MMFPAIPARNGLKMISRRNLLLGAAAGLAGGTGVSYAHYYEPTRFEVTHPRIRFFPEKSTDAPLKVLFLTDLHYSRYVPFSLISQAIALGLAEKPDLILLGGDYVTFDMPLDFPAYSKVLAHNPDSKDVLRKSDWDLMLCGLRVNCRPEVTILELM